MSKLLYRDVHTNEFSDAEIWDAIKNNDTEALVLIPMKLGFCHDNWKFTQEVSVVLSEHPDEYVRGNSMRGFVYTAMTHQKLEKNIVKPVLLRALKDPSEWVRGCAQEAIDDINRFLGWRIGTAKDTKEREKRFNGRRKNET